MTKPNAHSLSPALRAWLAEVDDLPDATIVRGAAKIAALAGVSRHTVYAWYAQVDAEGYPTHPVGRLLSRDGEDTGGHRTNQLCMNLGAFRRYSEGLSQDAPA